MLKKKVFENGHVTLIN